MADGSIHLEIARCAARLVGRQGCSIGIVAGRIRFGGAGAGRLVGERARDTQGLVQIAGFLFADLLAADDAAFGIVGLARGFRLREIEGGGNLGVDLALADDGLEQLHDTLGIAVLELAPVVEFLVGLLEFVAALAVEQAAELIHHRDLFRFHQGHAGRHQVDDGLDLGLTEAAPGIELDHHRCTGPGAIADEDGLLGQGQVHAGLLDAADGFHRTRQLGFQRVIVSRRFHELAGAEALVFLQHLEALGAAAGESLGRQLEAGFRQLRLRDQDRPAAAVHLELDAGGIQHIDDLVEILWAGVAVQGGIVRLAHPQGHHHAQGDGEGQADQPSQVLDGMGLQEGIDGVDGRAAGLPLDGSIVGWRQSRLLGRERFSHERLSLPAG